MLIKNRYEIFKKDIDNFDVYYSVVVYDRKRNDFITLRHRRYYMFYSKKEIKNIVFNLFVELLEDKFISISEKNQFIDKNNLVIIYD